jgi:hypothetical protein
VGLLGFEPSLGPLAKAGVPLTTDPLCKAAIAGLGFTPAVQIRVAAGMDLPSARVTRKPS